MRPGRAVGPWVLGLIGAIALHAFWNGSVGVLQLLRALHGGAGAAVRAVRPGRRSPCGARRRGSRADGSATTPPPAGSRRRRWTCWRPRRPPRRPGVGEDAARGSHAADAAVHPRRHRARRRTAARDHRARSARRQRTRACCSRAPRPTRARPVRAVTGVDSTRGPRHPEVRSTQRSVVTQASPRHRALSPVWPGFGAGDVPAGPERPVRARRRARRAPALTRGTRLGLDGHHE